MYDSLEYFYLGNPANSHGSFALYVCLRGVGGNCGISVYDDTGRHDAGTVYCVEYTVGFACDFGVSASHGNAASCFSIYLPGRIISVEQGRGFL